jgi:hypothetical protein
MYCEDSQGTDIEHFRPKDKYPEHALSWPNYLLACSHCNSNEKRTTFPLDDQGEPLLLDPTVDTPSDHLSLSPRTGRLIALDSRGDETIKVCGLNRTICEMGRQDAWRSICALAIKYAEEMHDGDLFEAAHTLNTLYRSPFQSVRDHMAAVVRDSAEPGLLIPARTLAAIEEFPELLGR